MEILRDACRSLPAVVEGYKKDDAPDFVAGRFAELVEKSGGATWIPRPRTVPAFVGRASHFPINGGVVWIDDDLDAAATAFVVEQSGGLLRADGGRPVLAVSADEAAGKDSELIALEIECRRAGRPAVFVDLPIEGLDGESDE